MSLPPAALVSVDTAVENAGALFDALRLREDAKDPGETGKALDLAARVDLKDDQVGKIGGVTRESGFAVSATRSSKRIMFLGEETVSPKYLRFPERK